MTDRKPPRFAADERETLRALLQYQRDSFVRKVADVDDDTARRALVPSGTTLLWLTTHLADAESLWVLRRFAGEAVDPPAGRDTMAAAVDAYRGTWARVDAVVTAESLDASCRGLDDGTDANLRWVVAHLLEETARHAGHADVLRELIDGSTGR